MEDKIKRINELYRKMKAEGLTVEEQAQQESLRREYIEAMKASVKNQLGSIRVVKDRSKD